MIGGFVGLLVYVLWSQQVGRAVIYTAFLVAFFCMVAAIAVLVYRYLRGKAQG